MDAHEFAERIELFHGRLNPASAHVYAQLTGPEASGGYALSGFIRGPQCLFSTTLPATLKFTDAGPGESLLANVIVPDPCFWTPTVPALYEVQLQLRQGDKVVAEAQRNFGLQAIAPRGRFFYEQGKRFVLRGVAATNAFDLTAANSPDLLPWRDAGAALLAVNPTNALCEEASRVGVLLVACISAKQNLVEEVRRLAQFAAVTLIAIRGAPTIDKTLRIAAKNTMLARWLKATDDETLASDADALVVEVRAEAVTAGAVLTALNLPVIVWQQGAEHRPQELPAARAAADALQAALASRGDFAGYFV